MSSQSLVTDASAHDRRRYRVWALVVAGTLLMNGCTHPLPLDKASYSGSEILLLLEYGSLFLVSPQGGAVQQIPHSRDIYLVRGSSITPKLLVATLDEQRRRVFEELTLEGEIIQRHDTVPQGHGITIPPEGEERQPAREALSPDRRYLAYWKRSEPSPNPEWDLYVQELTGSGTTVPLKKITTRRLRGYGFVNLLRWSPDSQWLVWGEVNDRGRFLGREPFYHFFKIRIDGSGLQEIDVQRPFWHRLWREIWPPEEKRGYPFELQWWRVPGATP